MNFSKIIFFQYVSGLFLFLTLLGNDVFAQRAPRFNTQFSTDLMQGSETASEDVVKIIKYVNKNLKVSEELKKVLLNPNHPDFWNEGSTIPDGGYKAFAIDPTNKELAKAWLIRNELKRKRTLIMLNTTEDASLELIELGIIPDALNELAYLKDEAEPTNVEVKAELMSGLEILFFHQPGCSACIRVSRILIPFKKHVTPIQVTKNELHKFDLGFNKGRRADPMEMRKFVGASKVTPVVVILDRANGFAAKLLGSDIKSASEIVQGIATVSRYKTGVKK